MVVALSEQECREIYRRGLTIRVLAAGALLAFFGVAYLMGPEVRISGIQGVLWTLAVLVSVNPLLWWAGEHRGFPIGDFYVHWCGDVLAATLVVYYLGVLDVPMAAAGYMIMIVSSATFATMRSAFLLAICASLCYVSIAIAEGLGVVPHEHVSFAHHLSTEAQVFSISGAIVLFHIFAYLGGTLASQLRGKAEEIAVQKEKLEESYGREQLAREGMVLLSTLVQHDVYSPLGVVSGACKEAADSCARGDLSGAVRFIEIVKERLGSIESAVKTLGLFQQAHGEWRDNECEYELREVAEELVDDLRAELVERGVDLVIEGEWPRIELRRERIYHVLRNLVTNAIKAVCDDGSGRVSIRAERTAGHVAGWAISVVDNGPGVPGELTDRILTTVPPVLGDRRPIGGFGAGLALSRNLTLGWGGMMSYRPRETGGSVFTVTIPRKLMAREGQGKGGYAA